MEIKIEKNVGMPVASGVSQDKAGEIRKSLASMEVDDSFAFAKSDYGSVRMVLIGVHGDPDKNVRYVTRKVDDKTRRCWRVK